MAEPTEYRYRELIWRLLDWDRVQQRLSKYPHIERHFPLDHLESWSDKPPYFCHFLAWRLGVWNSEDRFEHLEDLLRCATGIDGWKDSRCTDLSPEYDHFHGLIWELQVARMLTERPGFSVQWLPSGPDLGVYKGRKKFFVECYTYRKSFGVEAYIDDILSRVSPCIRVKHGACMKFHLPHNGTALAQFLEELLEPFLDPHYISEYEERARRKHPVPIPIPSSAQNFYVYFDSYDADSEYDSFTGVPNSAGDTDEYLRVALREIASSKLNANDLRNYRPNLVAANVVLSGDYQMAANRSAYFSTPLPEPQIKDPIDGLLVLACGIDSIPDLECAPHWFNDDGLRELWEG